MEERSIVRNPIYMKMSIHMEVALEILVVVSSPKKHTCNHPSNV